MRHFNAEILGRFGLVLGPSAVTGIVFERPRTRDRDGVNFFYSIGRTFPCQCFAIPSTFVLRFCWFVGATFNLKVL